MKNKLLSYLDEKEPEMFSLLQNLVLQRSYTNDAEDVNLVGNILRKSLENSGMRVETFSSGRYGDHLIFRSPACSLASSKQIMLVGHMDTVFPRDMGFNSYKEDDKNIYGPGVIDMKGGLVTAVYAIKAFSHCGLLDTVPVTIFFNSEEEKGSPESKILFRKEAEKTLLALVFECGGMKGECVTGRKGKLGFTIKIKGKAGHAAFAGKDKASSILELAHKIVAIEKLNDPARQLIVNVGKVKGGIGPNTVAEKAVAQVDCRFITPEDKDNCFVKIKQIVAENVVHGVTASYEIPSARDVMPPSEKNRKILKLFQENAALLNQGIGEEFRSGVSDANTLSGCGIPVLDGLGPIGEFDHSDKEYMIKKSLPERARLTTITLFDLFRRNQENNLF